MDSCITCMLWQSCLKRKEHGSLMGLPCWIPVKDLNLEGADENTK
jgi:hypothetical protein